MTTYTTKIMLRIEVNEITVRPCLCSSVVNNVFLWEVALVALSLFSMWIFFHMVILQRHMRKRLMCWI